MIPSMAKAVGQPSCDKRDAGHRQVEGCEEKPYLSVRKPEIVLIERCQGIDAVLRARSEDVRCTYQSENHPSKITALLGYVGHILTQVIYLHLVKMKSLIFIVNFHWLQYIL